jgi:hypothetical protein
MRWPGLLKVPDTFSSRLAEGTPEDVARQEDSHTGQFLRPVLGLAKQGQRWVG